MRFICIESYMIPTFGNRRTEPYGRMVVEHNGETRTVRFGERDGLGRRYITFNRKRYYFHNKGGSAGLPSGCRKYGEGGASERSAEHAGGFNGR